MKRDSGKPTAKWLDMAKTSVARKHIRSALDLPERAPVVQPKPDTRKLRQKLQKKKPKA
jgi:(p)ppGpp synthase/HD superfamily hydrolase